MITKGFDQYAEDDHHHAGTLTAPYQMSSTLAHSSLSASLLRQDDKQNIPISQVPFSKQSLESRLLVSSQASVPDQQRRRPSIKDPYQLLPNSQLLDDWMIVTTGKSRKELSEMHGYSEEQITVYEESFSLLDKDGDGNISNHEIRSLMSSLGYLSNEDDISSVISKIDVDGDGTVDFDEFLTIMRRRMPSDFDNELQEIFEIFDKNKDGFIDKEELYDMLLRLGENITNDDIVEMLDEADCIDYDGKVSFEEFKAILSSK